jgi:hypothetical protein
LRLETENVVKVPTKKEGTGISENNVELQFSVLILQNAPVA